ncbi:LacI family DNA-binding transcriptional regulator [Lactiplantibacillus pentosus]|uniref:LacI family DNA-binding transcriptional regulator n=1 Tax=Lactiplantibacillus pentosus TaxID=1589 RepID=UPI0034D6E545
MEIKMDDIARLANVSRSAVSLALNGKDGVSEATRAKIFKVIDKYNYKPLRKSKKNLHELATVNLLVVKSFALVGNNYRSLPFFDNLISSLSERISNTGGTLQISTIDSQHLEQSLNDLPNSDETTGTIVLATDLSESEVRTIQAKLENVVFIDTYYRNIKADFVTMDNYQGAFDAGIFMLNKVYQRIGYIASNKLIANFQMRRTGFNDALATRHISIQPQHYYQVSPTATAYDELDIHQIIDHDAPDAVFCEGDYIATRLIKQLVTAGIKVPDEIGVMGFDDIYEGTLLMPELSTVHVPIYQIASQAIQQLRGQVFKHDYAPQKSLISTHIIERNSI